MQPTPCSDTGRRPHWRIAVDDENARPQTLQVRTRLCRLDGPDAQGSFNGWPSPPWRHNARRRRTLAKRAGQWVNGATAVLKQVRAGRGRNASPWLQKLLEHKKPKLVAVALANRTARIAWKLMVSGERYRVTTETVLANAA